MNVDFGAVARDVGRILLVVSLMAVLSTVVAAVNGELFAVPAFVLSAAVLAVVGGGLARRYRTAGAPSRLDAMVSAASAWGATGVVGAIPFLVIAWTMALDPYPAWANTPAMNDTVRVFLHPLDAVFESMSGFTGTGLTMASVEEDLPRALHWWRSFTEWVGGVGVVVLTVAVLARPGSGSYALYESEARTERIRPSVVSTVREIWKIDLGLTVAAVALLYAVGMPPWDALNHAMTGLATGGFSVHAASIGHYDSPLVEYAVVPVMVAGSIAFPVYYAVFRGDVGRLYRDLQTRWVFVWFAAGSAVLTLVLQLNGQYDTLAETVRVSIFQFVSATSNAGFATAAVGAGTEQVWGGGATLFTCVGMLTGAAAGSTVSGLKLIRVITLVRGTVWQLRGIMQPQSAVRRLTIDDRTLDEQQVRREYTEATLVFVLWVVFLVVGIAVFLSVLPESYPLEYVVFDVMSAQSNVGLDSGITGPEMPVAAKAVLVLNMWVGRLEIIPVAVLISTVLRRLDPG
jgi:trk system potassium uptake protein TrkH